MLRFTALSGIIKYTWNYLIFYDAHLCVNLNFLVDIDLYADIF